MLRNIFKVIAIFIIGTVGGIFADQILWPYFIERPLFYEYRLEQSPVYITERKEVTIQENTALEESLEKVKGVVVGIKSEKKNGEVLQGSGLIITSDGLLVTLNDLLPIGSDFYFLLEGKWPSWQVLKRDVKNNLALVKVEASGLPTVAFADFNTIKIGERVFLMGVVFEESEATSTKTLLSQGLKTVNEGIIKSFNKDFLQTNILEEKELKGSPLFDIKGDVVGLSLIDEMGKVSAISVKKIKDFVGF